jgi:hypothetical protein
MKFFSSIILKSILSFLIGLSLAFAFAFPYFSDETYTLLDKSFLVAIPAFALTSVVFFLLNTAGKLWGQISNSSKLSTLILAYLAAGILCISMCAGSLLLTFANFISLSAIFSAVVLPAAPSLQKSIEAKEHSRLFLSWVCASVAAFFATGFLSNFYAELYLIALLTIFSQFLFGAFFYYTIGRLKDSMQKDASAFCIAASLFALVFVFQAMIFRMGSQFPMLFNANLFLLEGWEVVLFLAVSVLSLPWLAWILSRLREPVIYRALNQNKFIFFIQENLSGLSLSASFFGLYLLIGSILNSHGFDVDDIFFDSDGFIWRFRLTTDHWQDFYWRSVHPLALLILRPSVNLLSLFLHGDVYFAAIVLTALAGAACVFLAWMFLKEIFQNSAPALIMAFLLGISTSHLIFGSLIETYIFLAVATLLFFVIIQRKIKSLPLLISVGVATMGVTLTNFAQTVIALFGSKPDVKSTIKYIFVVVALVVSLTLASNLFYPNASPYFFVPSSFIAEEQNVRAVSLNRAQALTRAFLFNNIAAPEPLLSHKDIPFTQFRFYRAEDHKISEYSTPLQSVTGWTWFALLAVAAIFFIKDFKSHNIRLALSLLGCVLFNLLIHLRYGKELFLYSPNWTYAVILLLGISWKNLLPRKWFQILLSAFLFLLMWNNAALLYTIMEISAPYLK